MQRGAGHAVPGAAAPRPRSMQCCEALIHTHTRSLSLRRPLRRNAQDVNSWTELLCRDQLLFCMRFGLAFPGFVEASLPRFLPTYRRKRGKEAVDLGDGTSLAVLRRAFTTAITGKKGITPRTPSFTDRILVRWGRQRTQVRGAQQRSMHTRPPSQWLTAAPPRPECHSPHTGAAGGDRHPPARLPAHATRAHDIHTAQARDGPGRCGGCRRGRWGGESKRTHGGR